MVAEWIAFLEANGPVPETRPEASTEALIERYPELASVQVEPVTIKGRGGAIEARNYRGVERRGSGLVWLHGGAWISGNLDMPEAHWVSLAVAAAGIPVVSADYRKTLGGVRFPLPSDDVLDAWLWAVEQLGAGDRMYLGGASAGATLAAGVAKRLRDGAGPTSAGLVLAYPLLHPELPPSHDELASAVASVPPGGFIFEPGLVRELTLNYVGDEALFSDPYAFPAIGELAGLPPTYIVNSEHDSLRASGEVFGAALAAAGVDVVQETEPDTGHGHLDRPLEPQGKRSLERIIRWILEAR